MNPRQSGMMLLEVLLAMVIMATTVIALLSSMQWQLTATDTLRQETLALWTADNALIEAGPAHGQAEQSGYNFSWQMTQTTAGEPPIGRTLIEVTSPDGRTRQLYSWTVPEAAQEPKK
ncbi:type II secretion system minor pseudopilin GspI [Enterobacter chuandaensis]|uniref:type II secretion system minor pseudopilin GspI n=1 Tax=Enterobacter chuandaensis TaxID=2497875 RepID=UPI003F42CDDC